MLTVSLHGMVCRKQRGLGASTALLCLLLAGIGNKCCAVCSVLDEELWIGDNWCTSIPCPSDAYILETGQSVSQSPGGEHMVEVESSFTQHHLCCTNSNHSQPEEQCYSIADRYAPYPGLESELVPAVYGHGFHMRCPLESIIPGTQYLWHRYVTIDQETRLELPADVELSEDGREWSVEALSEAHNGMYECQAINKRGTRVFSDIIQYFVSTSSCPYHGKITVSINSSSEVKCTKGERVGIKCTAVAVEEHEEPFWNHVPNDRGFSHKLLAEYDKLACRWTKTVTLECGEETAGTYICSVGSQGNNITIEVFPDDQSEHETDVGSEYRWLYVITVLTILCAVAVICAVVICVLVTDKYHFFKSTDYQCETTKEPPYEGFRYDAFISAHDEVKDFIQKTLLPHLESSSYRICWHSRDFIPGIPIMEQISQTMTKSRKIIFVFSEHFSQSKFCCAELELAMSRYMRSCTRCILPVTMASSCVPQKLKQLITYLPLINANEGEISEKINKVMGQPIPPVIDRWNDSLIEE